mmetsp:Transcript_22370/g.88416  ORF Transcript_22370/g.88416 Transcript_22370/m.88416 type:complete len:497 (-) Transcript_22370:1609-3099(-)
MACHRERAALRAHGGTLRRAQRCQPAQALGHRGRVLRRHGEARAGLGHRVIARLDRVQHRAAGHQVVDQLVGRDAEAVDGRALPADVGNVELAQQRRDLGLGDGRKEAHVLQPLGGRALRQAGRLVATANQHKAQRLALQLGRRVQQHVQRIRQAHRTGIAHDDAPRRALGRDVGLQGLAERRRRALPLVGRKAIGHDMELGQVQPARGHVLVHAGQHRDDDIRIAVGIGLGLAAEHRERMPRRHARQLDQRQRPEVVHLVDQLGLGQFGQLAGHPHIHRVGAGRDDRVGPELARQPPGVGPQLAQKAQDVAKPANAIALVARRGQPAVADAVDDLLARPARNLGLHRPHMRVAGRNDQHLMPGAHPFAGQVEGPELHAMARRAGVVVDQQDVHVDSSRRRVRKRWTCGSNRPFAATQSRLTTASRPASRAAMRAGRSSSARPPSATISPRAESPISSRLAARSDSSGTQPWAMASSTDTDTESLCGRLRNQVARA